MSWRIIDVSQDGRYLHAEREWLVVSENKVEIGRVPLVDIHSILVHARHATYSHGLLTKLAGHEIPLVVCDDRHEPVAMLASLGPHHLHAGRARAQSGITSARRKRLWRGLVRKKIQEQARSLEPFDRIGAEGLRKMLAGVQIGDRTNMEARAARYYWPRLFGPAFRRERGQPGLNAHLNYGYTILRSAVARAVTAAGLIPALGVGHTNARNNFCLADDIVEPFRPLVDRLTWRHREIWEGEITPEARACLSGMMAGEITTDDGDTDLYRAITLVVNSLVRNFEGTDDTLYLPSEIAFVTQPPLPGLEAGQ
jgi:CRISP-associated protein Cas1